MSAAREIARAQQRQDARELRRQAIKERQQMGDVPTTGAVDLQALKGGDKALQRAALKEQLKQAGFACPCGARFLDGAIQAVGWILGQFPEQRPVQTPQGIAMANFLVDGARLRVMSFCSRSCVEYLDALKNGMPVPEDNGLERPKVRAVRSIPPVYWVDDEDDEAEL